MELMERYQRFIKYYTRGDLSLIHIYRKIGRYSEYSEAVGEVPGAAQLLGASQAPARKRRGLFGRG